MSRDTLARIRGLAVFPEYLADEQAYGDQRRRTGSGSALEALRDDALYFTLTNIPCQNTITYMMVHTVYKTYLRNHFLVW